MATILEIPKTMRAATIVAFNEPLQILSDVPVPDLPADRILVKVEASSLCSTDLAAFKGYMSFMTIVPYCGGHEPVGIGAKVGSNVTGFKAGDRVGYMRYSEMCGTCEECKSDQHRYCSSKKILGFSDPFGGFSEYAIADPRSTVRLPDNLSFDVAAPLLCAGITSYSSILKAKVPPGQLLNVVGCGGLGHVAILFAKAMGYRVHGYDIAEEKLKLAKECGADEVFNSLKADPKTFEPAHATIVFTGAQPAYDGAVKLTRNHGRVVAVGLPAANLGINVPLWGSKGLKLIPINTGSIPELRECLELAARHNIRPKIEVRHIDTINQGYTDLAEGKIDGRIVYHFS